MAVEKKRVIDRIKAKWPNLNLSQTRLDALADKLAKVPADDADDAAVDAVLDAQNDVLAFEDIAKMDDRTRTLEAENKKLKDAQPPTPPTPPTPPAPPAPDDAPAWAKLLIESNKSLQEKVESLEKGKTQESNQSKLKDLFSKSDVFKALKPEQIAIFERSVDFDSETPLEDQVKALETTAQGFIQTSNDNQDFGGPAGGGFKPANVDKEAIEDMLDERL